MKGQKSPLVVLYRSKTLLNSRLGSWHKALPGANSLALTSRTPELSYNCNAKLILVKKSLCLRVQRFIPKGSGIQQPGKRGVFKNPYSKNTNHTSHFGRGKLYPNNMGTYGKFIKSWTQFWMECANSGSLGKWSEPRRSGKHAGVASWDNFTQVKGPFT